MRRHIEIRKLLVVKKYPTSIKSLHLADFQSSTSATAVTGLQIEPELILLEARESSTVTSHGTSVKPSGCF